MARKDKMTTEKYKGKTAKEWFKLHEVMRKDFKRVLAQKQRAEKLRDEWCDAYTNMRDFAKSKGLDTTTTNRK